MEWWRDAVIYQVYVRSFCDSDADGVGDLDGVRSRLGYLELLGVDAVWLTPFYPSPMADHGYDVADPRDVDPTFGDLAAFDALVDEAHRHGIRVTIDLVPNHTSSEHEWFRAAFDSAPDSPERARYHFRPGRGPDGAEPPNNWQSVFGGPAWTRLSGADGSGGEWYLHLFAAEQPDLNWTNPEVWADLEKTLRFWCDRGVDGFRIDVAHGMAKPEGLPDDDGAQARLLGDTTDDPRFDDDGVHDVHRMIRAVLDHYPGRMAIGEVWVYDDERFARYVRPDELHLGFNFRLLQTPFDATAVRTAIEHSIVAVESVGARPTWTLSNHDVSRPVTRFGGGAVGLARARAMALVTLALPGVVYLYNGEELGLPDVDLPGWALQDPVWERSGHTERGRDGYRVPVPWEGGPPGYGFSEGKPWLPMPDGWSELTAAAQLEDADSTLSMFRRALELRHSHAGFATNHSGLEWYGAPPGCLAFRRPGSTLVCALNASESPVPLPPGDVLLTSGPLAPDGLLPPNTAAWLA
ncbi:alpha-amylase family protein [Pseudonocardia asaccharolytica DSM 44247 = NBRC 16224]|uniref:Alpha-amylase family protein n=1 Tax=Pseudonocardia asaccharolytica DSM 44247 = NBRC 16224 TaxID=1123024 RepID=A0A511D7W8_9PSEU|nr:alpha-amylase family protein [Pseudonocardia asaccharolytica DSM 44247 = NBRC 16224]